MGGTGLTKARGLDKPWPYWPVSQTIEPDMVNHPPHYTTNPSGIECIQVTEHMNFCMGNAMKYLWRADEKGNPIGDLKKARWYIDREIQRRERDDVA